MDRCYNMRILLISDIHGNFPALQAVGQYFAQTTFDHVVNCGDSLVYAPFPNETISWLREHAAISILGNTDKKVIRLLLGKSFKKPSKEEKRIMYNSTADALTAENQQYLMSLPISSELPIPGYNRLIQKQKPVIGVFHGSPEAPHEFLFSNTPDKRFAELSRRTPYPIIVTGHSHTPYSKKIGSAHFINPGSIGRMFDGNPAASCAVLTVAEKHIELIHYRIPYSVSVVVQALRSNSLPEIYATMYERGEKLN